LWIVDATVLEFAFLLSYILQAKQIQPVFPVHETLY